ncbi:hypothetical protein AAY473_012548 [Plecturocebus cupreus]
MLTVMPVCPSAPVGFIFLVSKGRRHPQLSYGKAHDYTCGNLSGSGSGGKLHDPVAGGIQQGSLQQERAGGKHEPKGGDVQACHLGRDTVDGGYHMVSQLSLILFGNQWVTEAARFIVEFKVRKLRPVYEKLSSNLFSCRLDYSSTIIAHCNINLLGSNPPPASAS